MPLQAPVVNAADARPSWDEVIRLVGELDDATIETILSTGATYGEVKQAVSWACGECDRVSEGNSLTGGVAAVYDILVATPAFTNPTER